MSQPRLASGQPVSLEQTYAYDGGPTGAVPLPSPSSQAVAVIDGGSGSMIGGTYSKRKTAGADGNVVLNLASVPLQQAAKTVLGDMIGVNYVVDPRVDGVISVQTTRPVSKAEAMEMFQTALVPIGAVLVQSRGTYRIAPADQAATGVIATGDGPAESAIAGNGIRVVSLKYVSATEVARVLEPMVPKGAIVQADDARNILALKGSPAEIESMLDLDFGIRCRCHEGHVVCRRSGENAPAGENGRRTEGDIRGRQRGAAQGPRQVHRQHPAWRDSGRDLAAELFAEGADLDQAARCQGRRLRAAASRLSGAEPAGGGARQRAAVDVCE